MFRKNVTDGAGRLRYSVSGAHMQPNENSPRAWRSYHYINASSSLKKDAAMHITLSLAPLVSLIAGLLILIVPRLLNYIVGLYLIIIGLLGLFGASNFPLR
jgi:hypothetical protein